MSLDALLSRVEEVDWSRHWCGWNSAQATELPARFRHLLLNPNTELRAQFTKDLQFSARAWAVLAPSLFDALAVTELPSPTRRFLARSLATLAWPDRWLGLELNLPDDEALDRKADFVRQARMPEPVLNGSREARVQAGIDWGSTELEPHHLKAVVIPTDVPVAERARYLERFGVTMGLEFPAQQETRKVIAAHLVERPLLEDADDGVVEESLVTACALPRHALELQPRLWKVVESRPSLAPQALLALAFQGAPRVHAAALVLADLVDPRDDLATFYLAVAEVFCGQGPVSRNARARLARRNPPTFLQSSSVFASSLEFLLERTNERLYPKKK